MYPHHQSTIERITAHFQSDPTVLAIIIGGSVAKGWAAADSDVDFMLVVTDEDYARRALTNDFIFFTPDLCTYEGGYVDGKIFDLGFLREVAESGHEPARAAFLNAIVTFSRLPEIDALVQQIPVYPEATRAAKIEAFYSQLVLLRWYMGEAEKRQDVYLRTHVAGELVLFSGRLILAHNRLLYPYHKWFMHVLRSAPEKPADLIPCIEALLAQPNPTTAQALFDCVSQFQPWEIPLKQAVANFMRDREWNWRDGQMPPVQDW